jgi:hypothetical protein
MAGEPFSPAAVPYPISTDLAAQLQDYAAIKGFKSLALNPSGAGFVAGETGYLSQAEASRVALEGCQVAASDQPCAIFAEGNTIKYGEHDFVANLNKVLERGARTFNPATVPFVLDTDRAQNLPAYAQSKVTYKAYALNVNGDGWMVTNTVVESQAEADALALQRCEGSGHGRPCTLYAEGDQVVFNVSSLAVNETPAVSYTATVLDINAIPFLLTADKRALANAYAQHQVSGSRHNAIAISWQGWNYVFEGASSSAIADTGAIAGCNKLAQENSCFLYAVDNTVVMAKSDIVK